MTQVFNVYCDESCHLEHDRQKVMVLGAIGCSFRKPELLTEQPNGGSMFLKFLFSPPLRYVTCRLARRQH
jgi:hypothetical protein